MSHFFRRCRRLTGWSAFLFVPVLRRAGAAGGGLAPSFAELELWRAFQPELGEHAQRPGEPLGGLERGSLFWERCPAAESPNFTGKDEFTCTWYSSGKPLCFHDCLMESGVGLCEGVSSFGRGSK